MKALRIITTGGTLDKVHCWRTEQVTFESNVSSRVSEILSEGRCYYPEIEHLMQIDSLSMTDKDRALILSKVKAAPEKSIVITHGTSTLGVTARYLDGVCEDRTVVLTGAMRPHSLSVSDAGFNLGGALIAAQSLPPGVYGVMNGRYFPAASLDKNEALGRFDV